MVRGMGSVGNPSPVRIGGTGAAPFFREQGRQARTKRGAGLHSRPSSSTPSLEVSAKQRWTLLPYTSTSRDTGHSPARWENVCHRRRATSVAGSVIAVKGAAIQYRVRCDEVGAAPRPPQLIVDQQIGPCPIKASRKLITVLAVTEAFAQNRSVGGFPACAKSGVPSTATTRENSMVFMILTSSLFE